MEKHNLLFIKSTIKFGLIFTIILSVSCSDNNANAQQKTTVSDKTKIAPEIDIHSAVITGNIEIIKQHIAAGSDLNQKDALGGSSPLITACLYEKKDIALLLIKAGADINFRNNDGSTPLHVASFFCKSEMVKLLLDNKANKTIKNNYNSTAYETVSVPYNSVKAIYEQMKGMLEPMGVQLNLEYIQKTRPIIAKMLE